MDTIQQRLKYLVELFSRGKHTVFAKKCGIPPGSFQAYINGIRIPPTEHLIKLIAVYGINLNWLLAGEGEPFIGRKTQNEKANIQGKPEAIDLATQLLSGEEERARVTLTPEQRTAILKILREFVHRDVRLVRELIRSIHAGRQGNEL